MLAEKDDTARLRRHTPGGTSVNPGPRDRGVVTVLQGANVGELFTIDGPRTLIGRGGEAKVVVRTGGASRRHAVIENDGQAFYIQDLGSTNGTYVDGKPVEGRLKLTDGCRIEVGADTVLRFALHDEMEQEAARRTHELTIRDPLTKLLNRRHLEERLTGEVAYSRRHGTPLNLLMVDIDRFKAINDKHGHDAGDAVLRVIARVLERTVREEDMVARFGGEEFLILARGIDQEGAARLGERIREGIEALAVPYQQRSLKLTASVGVGFTSGGQDVETTALLKSADAALYNAKAQGRNRVVLAEETHSSKRTSGTRHRTV